MEKEIIEAENKYYSSLKNRAKELEKGIFGNSEYDDKRVKIPWYLSAEYVYIYEKLFENGEVPGFDSYTGWLENFSDKAGISVSVLWKRKREWQLLEKYLKICEKEYKIVYDKDYAKNIAVAPELFILVDNIVDAVFNDEHSGVITKIDFYFGLMHKVIEKEYSKKELENYLKKIKEEKNSQVRQEILKQFDNVVKDEGDILETKFNAISVTDEDGFSYYKFPFTKDGLLSDVAHYLDMVELSIVMSDFEKKAFEVLLKENWLERLFYKTDNKKRKANYNSFMNLRIVGETYYDNDKNEDVTERLGFIIAETIMNKNKKGKEKSGPDNIRIHGFVYNLHTPYFERDVNKECTHIYDKYCDYIWVVTEKETIEAFGDIVREDNGIDESSNDGIICIDDEKTKIIRPAKHNKPKKKILLLSAILCKLL